MASPTATDSLYDFLHVNSYNDSHSLFPSFNPSKSTFTTNIGFLGLTSEEQKEQTHLLDVASGIRDVYLWIWTLLGIPANVIIVVTILCMKVFSPATFFVTALAVSDGVALLSKFIGFHLENNHVNNLALCKMYLIVPYFSVLANWTQVAISFERFISVCYPLKKACWVTKHRCVVAASIISAVLFILYAIPPAFMFGYNGFNCVYPSKYAPYFQSIWPWIHGLLYHILPFLIITGLTVAIIRSLVLARKHRTSLLRKGSGKPSEADRRLLQRTEMAEKMITIMLIVSSILFVVFTTPANVYFLWYDDDDHKRTPGHAEVFRQVATMLADATHVFNFFLYFLSAKRFRMSTVNLFCKKCLPQHFISPSEDKTPSSDANNTKTSMLSHSNHVDTRV